MRKRLPVILLSLLTLLLALDCVHSHFLQNSNIGIRIGIPVSFDEVGDVSAIYFDGFLENQNETDIILLAMINAQPLPTDSTPTAPPDAVITVHHGATGYPYYVWFGEDSIIYGNGSDCKEIQNDHTDVVGLLKNIADSLKNNQNNT